MKRTILINTLAIFYIAGVFAQDKCSKFYPISEGASFSSAVYNTRDDAENNLNKVGIVTYSVDDVLDNAALYSITVSMDPMPPQKAQYKVSCTEDGVSIDPGSMAGGMMSRFSDAEISGDNIFLPNDLEGPFPKTLSDAEMTINASTAAGAITMNRNRTNRRVTGQENVITPARSDPFQCYILEYNVELIMNGRMVMTTKTKEWLAEGFGVVQSQEFDASGNETSFSWLVEYTR